jgi:hypothetical protein
LYNGNTKWAAFSLTVDRYVLPIAENLARKGLLVEYVVSRQKTLKSAVSVPSR